FEQFDMLLVPLDRSCLPTAWCKRAGRSPRLLRARLSDPPALNAIHYSTSPERRVVRAGILQARCPLQLLLQNCVMIKITLVALLGCAWSTQALASGLEVTESAGLPPAKSPSSLRGRTRRSFGRSPAGGSWSSTTSSRTRGPSGTWRAGTADSLR